MTDGKKLRCAVIGLGSMGLGMALALVRSGIEVTGVDINPDAIAKLNLGGGTGCTSIAEAATGCDVILSVVVNASQTDHVLFGAGGAAETMARGGVIISSATMAPEDARKFSGKAGAWGLHYLDAPISGGAAKAAKGDLTIMASGTMEAFAGARPALDAIAGTVYDLGREAGIGASFKMVNQLLAGVHIAAACEAITFAKRLGLDLTQVYKVITASAGNSWMFENRVPHIVDGDYQPRSAVSIFTKDLGIVADMGRSETFPLPLSSTALQMFMMTAAAGMAGDDDASVARMIAMMTGLDLPDAKRE